MKVFPCLVGMLLVLTCKNSQAQHPHDPNGVIQSQLAPLIHARFGSQTNFDYAVFDSMIGKNPVHYGFEDITDPYGTLRGCVMFSYFLSGDSSGVGMFRNGQIVWSSQPTIKANGAHWGEDIFATADINDDGEVDILQVGWELGKDNVDFMWIFSWDGTTGRIVNDVDATGQSTLLTTNGSTFELLDPNGDSVWDIRAYWSPHNGWVPDDEVSTLPFVTYGWNGSLYGLWPSVRQIPRTEFQPANRLSVTSQCGVVKTGVTFDFSYTIGNASTSKQRMSEFYLAGVSRNASSRGPEHWEMQSTTRVNGRKWIVFPNYRTSMLKPGQVNSEFGLSSSELPVIARYYARGLTILANSDDVDAITEETLTNDVLNNSYTSYTIGPKDPPTPFNGLTFLDTTKYYVTQSGALNWITSQSTASKYTRLLDTARAHLVANDRGVTKSRLDSVLINVHVDSASTLTSEAYALLRFNTEYLMKKLREEDSTFASANASSSSNATATNNARHLAKSEGYLHEVLMSGGTVFYRRSDDGGSAWDQTLQITENAGNSRPCIAIQHGAVQIVWQRQTDSSTYEVWHAYGENQGSSWSTPQILPHASTVQVSQYQTEGPMPVVAPLGTGDEMVAVYCSAQGLRYRTSQDRGSSWQAPQQDIISGESTGRSQFPSLAGADSYVSLLYDYAGLDGGPYSRIYDGSSWSKETSVADGTGTSVGAFSSVAIDPDKGPIAAWSGIANTWTKSIIFRMGYSDNKWSNWFVAFGGTQFGPDWFNPSLTYYIPGGGQYGVAIVNHTSSNLIKLIRYVDNGYEAPSWNTSTLSQSGAWANITQENSSSGTPIHCWTDQSSFPYDIVTGSTGEVSPLRGGVIGMTNSTGLLQKRRAVIYHKRLHATLTLDIDPIRIVNASGDTTVVPFKRSRMRDRDSINVVRVWDYLGSDVVRLPANARRLIVSKRFADRGPSIGRRGFAFRLLNGNGTPIALLDTTANSGTVSVNVEQYAGMSLILRPQVSLFEIDPSAVSVCAGDVFTVSDEQILPPNNRKAKSR